MVSCGHLSLQCRRHPPTHRRDPRPDHRNRHRCRPPPYVTCLRRLIAWSRTDPPWTRQRECVSSTGRACSPDAASVTESCRLCPVARRPTCHRVSTNASARIAASRKYVGDSCRSVSLPFSLTFPFATRYREQPAPRPGGARIAWLCAFERRQSTFAYEPIADAAWILRCCDEWRVSPEPACRRDAHCVRTGVCTRCRDCSQRSHRFGP